MLRFLDVVPVAAQRKDISESLDVPAPRILTAAFAAELATVWPSALGLDVTESKVLEVHADYELGRIWQLT